MIRPDLDPQDYKKASPLIDAVGVAERTLDNGSASTPRAQAVQDALAAEHMTAPTHQIKWGERRKISQKQCYYPDPNPYPSDPYPMFLSLPGPDPDPSIIKQK